MVNVPGLENPSESNDSKGEGVTSSTGGVAPALDVGTTQRQPLAQPSPQQQQQQQQAGQFFFPGPISMPMGPMMGEQAAMYGQQYMPMYGTGPTGAYFFAPQPAPGSPSSYHLLHGAQQQLGPHPGMGMAYVLNNGHVMDNGMSGSGMYNAAGYNSPQALALYAAQMQASFGMGGFLPPQQQPQEMPGASPGTNTNLGAAGTLFTTRHALATRHLSRGQSNGSSNGRRFSDRGRPTTQLSTPDVSGHASPARSDRDAPAVDVDLKPSTRTPAISATPVSPSGERTMSAVMDRNEGGVERAKSASPPPQVPAAKDDARDLEAADQAADISWGEQMELSYESTLNKRLRWVGAAHSGVKRGGGARAFEERIVSWWLV